MDKLSTQNTEPKSWQVPKGYAQVASTVPGISVYAPKPEEDKSTAPRTYTCPSCGATTRYDVSAGGVACEHCGYTAVVNAEQVGRSADQFEFTLETLHQAEHGWGVKRREALCESCGAELTLAEGALTATCPFCASNRVNLQDAPSDKLRPRFLVPFKLKAVDVQKLAAEWLGKGWYHPKDLAQNVRIDHFAGMYVPFWTFAARMDCEWQAEVGRERVVRDRDGNTRTVIDWSWRRGKVVVPVQDLLVNGSTHVSQVILERIQPFDLEDLVAYSPDFLAGWNAHAYDIPLQDAWEQGKQMMREEAKDACHRDISASHVRNFSMSADFADETWRYILLPVYLTSYRYADKTFQVMVNGQNGKVAGQKPVDWNKIWLAIAAMLLPGIGLGLIGLPLLLLGGVGVGLLVIGFVLLVIGGILSGVLYHKAVQSEAA